MDIFQTVIPFTRTVPGYMVDYLHLHLHLQRIPQLLHLRLQRDLLFLHLRQELLQHEIVVESLGGETQEIEVSATQKINLDGLLEAIALQSEILDLRATSEGRAQGVVRNVRTCTARGGAAASGACSRQSAITLARVTPLKQ